MSEIEYRVLRSEVSNGIDWQTEGRTLLSLCKGWLIAEGSENHIGNAADLLEQLEGQSKLGIDHLEVLKELLDGMKKCALVDKIEIFEIKRKNYLCMSEKVIRKLDELNCLERVIRICTPYLEEGIVDRIENIRFLFKKLESNCRLGPANLGILKEILKEMREDELLREVEEFEKQRKDEKIRDRRREEAEERRQATPIAIPEVVPILPLSEDTPGVQLNTTPSTSAGRQGELTPTDQNDFFSHEELFEIRSKAASVKNFAVHLTRMLFQPEELRGRNVRGVAGKQPLNPDKVKVIMDAVCKFYPAPPEGRDFQWRDCRKAVDTYLRGIKFSERNQ